MTALKLFLTFVSSPLPPPAPSLAGQLHSSALAALNVSTDVAEEAEGEPGPLGPTPAQEVFFPFPPGAVNAAPLTEVINAAHVTGITGTAGPPSDVQAGPAAIHGTGSHPAVAGAVIVSLVLFVVGAAIWAGRRFVTGVRRRRQVAVMELEVMSHHILPANGTVALATTVTHQHLSCLNRGRRARRKSA